MKSLTEYINESKSSEWFRVNLSGLELPDGFYESIESIGRESGVYTEKTDEGGFKLRIKPDTPGKLEGFIDSLNSVVAKNKDKKEVEDKVEKLQMRISKLMDIENGEDDGDDSGDGE